MVQGLEAGRCARKARSRACHLEVQVPTVEGRQSEEGKREAVSTLCSFPALVAHAAMASGG